VAHNKQECRDLSGSQGPSGQEAISPRGCFPPEIPGRAWISVLTLNTVACSRRMWEAPLRTGQCCLEYSSDEVTPDSLPESHLAAAAGAPETPNLSARAA
jgi:hypothetical protein